MQQGAWSFKSLCFVSYPVENPFILFTSFLKITFLIPSCKSFPSKLILHLYQTSNFKSALTFKSMAENHPSLHWLLLRNLMRLGYWCLFHWSLNSWRIEVHDSWVTWFSLILLFRTLHRPRWFPIRENSPLMEENPSRKFLFLDIAISSFNKSIKTWYWYRCCVNW